MARGQVFTVASGTNQTVNTQSREEKLSFVVVNPNDGVCYFKLNGPASPSPGGWDWKLPSQSAGAFGGPWQSLGIYFLDQSGAGRSGELNLFDADNEVQIPNIWAIGRALQAQATTLDITEGVQPANPAVGITRLWSDNAGLLYALLSSGVNQKALLSGLVAQSDIAPLLNTGYYRLGAISNHGAGGFFYEFGVTVVPGGIYYAHWEWQIQSTGATAVAVLGICGSNAQNARPSMGQNVLANGQLWNGSMSAIMTVPVGVTTIDFDTYGNGNFSLLATEGIIANGFPTQLTVVRVG